MINDKITWTGVPTVTLFDENGNIKSQQTIKNLVVTVGKNWIASRAAGTPSVMSHMAVGSNNTAPSTSNTTLTTETARVALTSTTVTNSTLTFAATFGPGVGTGVITEAGIFNASSAGTMLARTVFSAVNKDVLDSLVVSWDVSGN